MPDGDLSLGQLPSQPVVFHHANSTRLSGRCVSYCCQCIVPINAPNRGHPCSVYHRGPV